MSGSSTPTTDEPRMRITRTVAIIKNHALKYRLTIERRIEEAGFEIVKERQMEFADNSDKEFLDELFGIDSDSLFEGPVWVYVLERRRAVEVWKSLMGEPDPVKARESSPNSLRALFGITSAQNAVMGSPNTDTAEEQISCLFQSSPPFPPHHPEDDDLIDGLHNQMGYNTLNHEGEHHNSNILSASASNDEDEDGDEDWQSRETTVLSPSSSQLSSSAHLTSPASSTTTNITRSPFSSLSKKTGGPIPALVPFKARPVPKTTLVPDISPRTTRAASLRAGIAFPQSPSRTANGNVNANGNGGVNGGRGGTSSGTSTPINGTPERIRRQRTKEEQKQAFMDVPGHKRSTVIHVASTAAPAIAPRMSRAASLRLGLKVESPAPRMRSSRSDGSAAAGLGARSGSGLGLGAGAGAGEGRTSRPASMIFEGVPGHKRRETIAVASVQAPTVAPRTNKSAELRAKKDGAAPPPSSFMFRGPTAPKTPGGLSRPSSSLGSSRPASSLSRSTSSLGVNGNGNGNVQTTTTTTTGVVRAPSIEPRLNRSAMLRAKAGGAGASPVAAANRRRSMFV